MGESTFVFKQLGVTLSLVNHKISPDTNSHKGKHTHTKHKLFKEWVPSVFLMLKNHVRLGQTAIMDPSINLSIPNLKKKV